MSGLKELQHYFLQKNVSCVVAGGPVLLHSEKRGISPLLDYLQTDQLHGCLVADKIIGTAAAALLILGGAKGVYGQVMSRDARTLLEQHGIETACSTLTEHIVNRKGDGLCPMEQAVSTLQLPEELSLVPNLLRQTLRRLQENTQS